MNAGRYPPQFCVHKGMLEADISARKTHSALAIDVADACMRSVHILSYCGDKALGDRRGKLH